MNSLRRLPPKQCRCRPEQPGTPGTRSRGVTGASFDSETCPVRSEKPPRNRAATDAKKQDRPSPPMAATHLPMAAPRSGRQLPARSLAAVEGRGVDPQDLRGLRPASVDRLDHATDVAALHLLER